jgi:hypothetical protein
MSNVALEKLKKDDLVKLARAMRQEIKLLNKTKVKEEVAAKDLPLVGISTVQVGPGDFKLVKLGYDLESGAAGVISVETFQKAYQIYSKAGRFMVEVLHKQYTVEEKKDE